MKKLITEKTINDLKKNGQLDLYVEENTLITPSARDAIRNFGINLIYGKEGTAVHTPVNSSCSCALANKVECEKPGKEEITANADEAEIARLVDLIMEVLNERGLLKQMLDK